jgi:hypothetical protein
VVIRSLSSMFSSLATCVWSRCIEYHLFNVGRKVALEQCPCVHLYRVHSCWWGIQKEKAGKAIQLRVVLPQTCSVTCLSTLHDNINTQIESKHLGMFIPIWQSHWIQYWISEFTLFVPF